jgi:hypothetical protein
MAVKAESEGSEEESGKKLGSARHETRICPVCGTKFVATADREFCPVCILNRAFGGESAATGESGSVSELAASTEQADGGLQARRFEHYEVMLDETCRPIELGRGAMGVTYKAIDVDLRCPVTLKVISEQYLGDESARLRFLREARAAASVRHPNVASVFHLGRTGGNYFYAMEFVEGETLGNLIKRSDRLEAKLALEIATQVAAGLAAVHEQHLIHRDIKPTNIMVRLKEEGSVTAKIIDLGLAKTLDELASEACISMPGVFAGTPEFASPEQFAGVGVDIRSDLYSLGVTLWVMVTGQTPFRGSSAEVMYQHQHSPLPLERLNDIHQPVVVLLEKLLEKDPAQRFQTPNELLKAIPTIAGAIDARRRVARQNLQKTPSAASRVGTRKASARLAPKKISVAGLPVTGSDVFGREEDIAFLDDAWANQQVNVVTIVAWAGVGKSTLVNHWLRRIAAKGYSNAQLIFGWSFYRQGTGGETSSADEFLDAALNWFGDPDPRLGTEWEKGQRLARLVADRRTLLVLDGLEPLQNPPGSQEGRLRDHALQALLRELAAFNRGLCVITTRMAVADLAEHEGGSVRRLELEHLSNDAGAQLLRALGVKGAQAELRGASQEFDGHSLALTLLGSYLGDAYGGDIRCRQEVSTRLVEDVRQGAHARKVMASYQIWWGDGPEVAALRLLGLFDRPADETALGALLKPPAIPGLTESLTHLSPAQWRSLLARLRRSRLLAGEDPHQPGQLDAHPLVREYFGGTLREQRTAAWSEGNRRLYHHYRTLSPELPETLREMEPLFLAAICACQAGLFRECLHEIYIARIQRGNGSFAAKVFGARGSLLSVLVHFFENGRWGTPMEKAIEGQCLTADDQLFILMQAALHLTVTRGLHTPEAQICDERAEALCHLLNRPGLLHLPLIGQWRYSLVTENVKAPMRIANRLYSLAKSQNDASVLIKAHMALAGTFYWAGDFESARQNACRGIEIWRAAGVLSAIEEVDAPAVPCLCFRALSAWHFAEIPFCDVTMAEAISLAKELNDRHALAVALWHAGILGFLERDPAKVERLALELIELSTRQNFALWLSGGIVLHGWARSTLGHPVEGLCQIEDGLADQRAIGAILFVLIYMGLKAEALYRTDRISEALESIKEAETLVERFEYRFCSAELRRLAGVLLAAIGADEAEIEASFFGAVEIAKEQKSVSLEKRAEATYAEYRRQKASGSGGRAIRLPLW